LNRAGEFAAQFVAAVTSLEITTARNVTDHQKIEQRPQVVLEQHPFERIRREFLSSLSEELIKGRQLEIEISKAQGSKLTQQESDRLFENLKKLSSKDSFTSHPIFHVMCMTLAVNYIGLAETNLKLGDLRGALAALDSLAQILPELSAADKETLARSYPELQRVVQKTFSAHQQAN
jgi:hypothetical protein